MILILGRWLAQPILHGARRLLIWPSGFIGVITVLVFVAAALAEIIGIHAVFGAFLVSVALGQGVEKENQAHEVIYQFALSFFAPLYFVGSSPFSGLDCWLRTTDRQKCTDFSFLIHGFPLIRGSKMLPSAH